MALEKQKNITIRFTVYGILLGIGSGVLYLILQLSTENRAFSFSDLSEIHQNELTVALELFPVIILGLLGYFVGLMFKRAYAEIADIKEEHQEYNEIFDITEKLRQGETDFSVEQYDRDNEVINALINLRDELSKTKEEEDQRKKEDEQRHWTSEGMAKFGALLREHNEDMQSMSDQVVKEIVKYLDAKQASFFVVNDNDKENKTIEQTATYAYNRKKFTDNVLQWGEGLIGACIIEKKTIFMDEVPDSFVNITSGLGKANPRSILIVPFKTEDQTVHGALELASFKVYEPHEIAFVESVAESVATTITSLRNSMRTARLLDESRDAAKELAEKEEMMRKTVDEMRELQLEAAKQSEEFVSFTNSVNHTMIRAEYSVEGMLKYANTKFLEILGYESNKEVEGKYITDFVSEKDRGWFDEIWNRLVSGGKHFEGDMKHLTKEGKDVWTIATYVSVRDQEGKPEKILFLGIDTTNAKKQSLDFEGQINALNHSSLKAEFMRDGKIIEFNKKMLEALNYQPDGLDAKKIFDFIPKSDKAEYEELWNNIIKGVPYEGRIRILDVKGDLKHLHGTFSVVRDMYDEIAKIIFIGSDVTEQHIMEEKNRQQNARLKRQEEELQEARVQLTKKLKESREEMKQQFREIETVKLLHEKTLEGMLDAIVTINQDNEIEFFNRAAEDLWGFSKDEVIGKDVKFLLPDKHTDLDGEYLGTYFNSNLENPLVNTRTEVYIVDNNDEQVFVLLTLSEAGIGLRYRLTAFIQRIEVELF